MPGASITQAIGWEDGVAVLMARVELPSGVDAVIADITDLSLIVRDVAIPGTDIGASPYPLASAAVMFDLLQTDSIWTADTLGFNFKYNTLNAQMPDGEITYRFEFWFNPVVGEEFPGIYELASRETFRA